MPRPRSQRSRSRSRHSGNTPHTPTGNRPETGSLSFFSLTRHPTTHRRHAHDHDLHRRFGPGKSRAGRLRRGAALGPPPQGALAGVPPDDEQPHGAHGRLRGARGAALRGVGGHDLLRLEIRRRRRDPGWLFGWVRKDFAGKKNPDLWRRFLDVYRRHRVRFVWVKGHAETVENNRCDRLAVAAANDTAHLAEDTGYTPGEA